MCLRIKDKGYIHVDCQPLAPGQMVLIGFVTDDTDPPIFEKIALVASTPFTLTEKVPDGRGVGEDFLCELIQAVDRGKPDHGTGAILFLDFLVPGT